MFLLALACIDRADDHRELPDTEPGDSETAAVADPLDLGQQVEEQRLAASIEALEGFGTRHTLTDGDDQARAWLRDELEGYGLLVEEDGFVSQDFESANLIARIEGVEEPDVVYLLSAHYDSTSTNWPTDAPGADDNASGVAVVLEAARILADQPLRYSVWLVLTGAEEQGSLGSEHLADWLVAQGVDVRGVMAPDMIAYWPLGDDDAFDILGDDDSAHLAQRMGAIADELGVANKTWIHHDYCYGDDHTRFQEAGIPAISPMDCVEAHNLPSSGEKTPHYHRTSDTLDTLHLGFTTKVAQVMVATLASWGEPTSAH